MKTLTNNLPKNILSGIETTLNKALIQRGFPEIVATQDVNETRYPCVEIISEKFNTVPVIMEYIQIDNFGGSIREATKKVIHENESGDTIEEHEILRVWIDVHVSYSHFGGGTNGTALFTYTAEVHEWSRHEDSEVEVHLTNEVIR